jgi:hypothetical protein
MGDWVEEMPPEEREEWDQFVDHFRRDALAKMTDSAFVASLVPSGEFDVKFALETGAAVLLGKPILAIVMPGAEVPGKLGLVADVVVEADLDTEGGRKKVAAAISQMVEVKDE